MTRDNKDETSSFEEDSASGELLPAQPGLAALAAAGVGLAPLAAHDTVGAAFAALLTPIAASILQGAADEWNRIRSERAARVLTHAAEYSGINVEELLRRIGHDPAKLALLSNSIEAASRTNLENKIRFLGRVLAEGTLSADDALIDEQALLVTAVADLEVPHLQVLKIIADGTKRAGYMGAEWQGITEADIAASRRGLEGFGETSLLQPLLRVLDRNGLIYQTRSGVVWDENVADDIRPGAGSNAWAATRFAQSLLLMLLDGNIP
jgi:hypothetical protein